MLSDKLDALSWPFSQTLEETLFLIVPLEPANWGTTGEKAGARASRWSSGV